MPTQKNYLNTMCSEFSIKDQYIWGQVILSLGKAKLLDLKQKGLPGKVIVEIKKSILNITVIN